MDINPTHVIIAIFLLLAVFCFFSGTVLARPLGIAALVSAALTWLYLPFGFILVGCAITMVLAWLAMKHFSGPMF